MDVVTGPQLAEERKRSGISPTSLGRAMGYKGKSPHARVYQLEREAAVAPKWVAKYRAALASLMGVPA